MCFNYETKFHLHLSSQYMKPTVELIDVSVSKFIEFIEKNSIHIFSSNKYTFDCYLSLT